MPAPRFHSTGNRVVGSLMDMAFATLLDVVRAHIAEQGGDGILFPTAIPTLNIVQSFQTKMPVRQIYRPVLCVVLQGRKELLFGDDMLSYGEMECLVVGMEMPATGRIVQASRVDPYIGLTLEFDVAVLRDLLKEMDGSSEPHDRTGQGLFVEPLTAPLADCLTRLLRISASPRAIPVLYPAVVREILYWLLTGPNGRELAKLALPGSNANRVVKAIAALHLTYDRHLTVEELAKIAQMSVPSFHQNFKSLTSMTPIQFQKQLRLLEARRLMLSEAATVSEAAYTVGYQSPSQFSRDYSRTFGIPPKQDALNQKRLPSDGVERPVRAA